MAEKDAGKEKEMQKVLFMNLVLMLGATVMQQLGKVINPVTKKAELDMEGAQASIDTLVMLNEKTKGNLDADEDKLMKQTLSTVQMNYVETGRSAPAAGEAAEKKEPTSKPAPEEDHAESTDEKKDEAHDKTKEPKYHKSYS